ncbi:MAG TPA: hypothetical protein VGH28_01375 [Polyangiaceae bacterium]
MIRFALAALVAGVVACDSPRAQVDAAAPAVPVVPDAAAPTATAEIEDAAEDVTPEEVFEQSIKMLEEVATIVQDEGPDCDAIAARLEAYEDAHTRAIAVGHQRYDTLSDEERARVEAKYRDRYHAAWAKLHPNATKCRNNERVRKVANVLFGNPQLGPVPEPAESGQP